MSNRCLVAFQMLIVLFGCSWAEVAFGQQSGPEAVVRRDPNRLVANIGGKQLTARQAWDMLKFVFPPTRRDYESKGHLPNLLQRLYVQDRITEEAVKLHLDQQEPWHSQLVGQHLRIVGNHTESPGLRENDIRPSILAQWHSARGRILWNAYFSQAATPEETKSLHEKVNEEYKLEVLDTSFFK